jgi:DNA invertase Pin-like site-specific DNA recombinase
MNGKRAVIYVRVNKTRNGDGFEQNPEVQEGPLRRMIAQREWTLVRVYSDRMSGATENRPGLNGLMQAAKRGEFDVVVVWRFDRFARSIEQLVLALAEFRSPSSMLRRTIAFASSETDFRLINYPFDVACRTMMILHRSQLLHRSSGFDQKELEDRARNRRNNG